MSYMNTPRPSMGAPKRTMTAQLRALANTTAVMAAIFMVLLVAFVWMVTAINSKSSSKESDESKTTVSTSSSSEGAGVVTDQTSDTTPEATTTPEVTEVAHASYPEGTKLIALTFDDGPDATLTPQVLDALERNGVVATFFMIGQNVSGADASLLQRMLDLGCELGNHTWSHQILTKVSEDEAYEQLAKCDQAIEEKVGQKATVIRPPTGAGLKQEGLFRYSVDSREYVVNWNDSSCPSDWQAPALGDADYTAQYVIDHAIDGDMVLLHDSHKSTVDSLDKMIAGLKEKGYVFVTVSQLLEARVGNLTIEEAGAKGWDTSKLVEAYPGGPIYGIRYAYSSEKIIFEKKG